MNEDKAETKSSMKWIIIVIILIIAFLGFYLYNNFNHFYGIGKENYQSRFEQEINLLIMGFDNKDDVQVDKVNVDSIIIAKLKPDIKKLTITVVPTVIEYKEKKLQNYEREEIINIIDDIVGTAPEYYISIDYEGFKNIVNLISGIEIELKEEFEVPELGLYLKKGNNLLSGQEALNYFRYYDQTKNEMTRINRQQQIIKGFTKKMFQKNTLFNIPKLYRTIVETIKNINTNLDYNLAIEAYNFINNNDDFTIEYEVFRINQDN